MTTKDELQTELDTELEEFLFLMDELYDSLDGVQSDFDVHDEDIKETIKEAKKKTNATYASLKKIEKLTNELKLFGVT